MPSNDPDRMSPEAGGVLDRDQARAVIDLWSGGRIQYGDGLLDRLEACVRPVAGVTLTPGEAAQAATCVRMVLEGAVADPYSAAELTSLAARLEAAQHE